MMGGDRVFGHRLLLLTLLAAGCGGEPVAVVDGIFTEPEWRVIEELSPLGEVPADPTNAVADDPAAAALGQMLFFETDFAGPLLVDSDLGLAGEEGKVACATCHVPPWFTDTRSEPNHATVATGWTGRNTPPIANAAFYEWFFWAGRSDRMWNQALGPPEAENEMNGNRLQVAHVLFAQYRAEYDAVFDPDLPAELDPEHAEADRFPENGKPGDAAWEDMDPADQMVINRIYANFGKAIQAYERLLVSRDAPFDRYVEGDTAALGQSAKRGLKLFVGKAGCNSCHSGPFFSDQLFYNIGVPQEGEHILAEDQGRYAAIEAVLASPFNGASAFSDDAGFGAAMLDGLTPEDRNRGAFRTKSLREVAETGPYMHTGGFASLREVVEFYDGGGGHGGGGYVGTVDAQVVPLNLTEQEIDDLVAFLEALTGEPIPDALLQDTSR